MSIATIATTATTATTATASAPATAMSVVRQRLPARGGMHPKRRVVAVTRIVGKTVLSRSSATSAADHPLRRPVSTMRRDATSVHQDDRDASSDGGSSGFNEPSSSSRVDSVALHQLERELGLRSVKATDKEFSYLQSDHGNSGTSSLSRRGPRIMRRQSLVSRAMDLLRPQKSDASSDMSRRGSITQEGLEKMLGVHRGSLALSSNESPLGPDDDPELYNFGRWVNVPIFKIPYECPTRIKSRRLWARVRMAIKMGRRFRKVAGYQRMYGHVTVEEKSRFERTDGFRRLQRHDSTLTDFIKKQQNVPWLIHLKNPWKLRWEITVLVLILYSLFYAPARAVFISKIWHDSDVFDLMVDLLFLVDIVHHFFVPYRQLHGKPFAISRRDISSLYIRSYALADVFGALPFYCIGLFYHNDSSNTGRFLRTLRFLKLLRITRMKRSLSMLRLHPWYKRVNDAVAFNPTSARIAQLIALVGILSHVFACSWYMVSIVQESSNSWVNLYGAANESAATKWGISMYFFWTTLTTVGYGDVVPGTNMERFIATLNMIVGVTFYAYVTATLSSVVKSLDANAQEFRSKMAGLRAFMKEKRLCKGTRYRLKRHFRYAWQNTAAVYSSQDLFQSMPPRMRSDVAQEVYCDVISTTPFFKGQSSEFVSEIMTSVHPVELRTKDMLCHRDEQVKEWYVVKRGVIEAISSDGLTVLMTFGPGSTLGEIGMFANRDGRWPVDLVAASNAELLAVPKGALLALLDEHPGNRVAMIDVAMERYSRIQEAFAKYHALREKVVHNIALGRQNSRRLIRVRTREASQQQRRQDESLQPLPTTTQPVHRRSVTASSVQMSKVAAPPPQQQPSSSSRSRRPSLLLGVDVSDDVVGIDIDIDNALLQMEYRLMTLLDEMEENESDDDGEEEEEEERN